MSGNVAILGDSLTYHGPERAEMPDDARLWPQVMTSELAKRQLDVRVDLVARQGWTTRDGWWALTKDPRCWGEVIPRTDAVVIGLGGMDQLPAAVPTYLREGMSYLRPGALRRRVRGAYRKTAPLVMKATGGPFRQLPQVATDAYLRRIVDGIRYFRPRVPIVLLGPSPFDAPDYPVSSGHPSAVAAAARVARTYDMDFIDLDPLVWPSLRDGSANPDGMHWSWRSHAAVGAAVSAVLAPTLSVGAQLERPAAPIVKENTP